MSGSRRGDQVRAPAFLEREGGLHGGPIAVDLNAESAEENVPAFVARPPGAPVYHGFDVLQDVVLDGFRYGAITDVEAEPCSEGDGFVVAPDNSRAGLVWEVGTGDTLREVVPPDDNRWGVWGVWFPHPMTNRENARLNLECVLPLLKEKWEHWRSRRRESAESDASPNPKTGD
jgi:hypothetical protein